MGLVCTSAITALYEKVRDTWECVAYADDALPHCRSRRSRSTMSDVTHEGKKQQPVDLTGDDEELAEDTSDEDEGPSTAHNTDEDDDSDMSDVDDDSEDDEDCCSSDEKEDGSSSIDTGRLLLIGSTPDAVVLEAIKTLAALKGMKPEVSTDIKAASEAVVVAAVYAVTCSYHGDLCDDLQGSDSLKVRDAKLMTRNCVNIAAAIKVALLSADTVCKMDHVIDQCSLIMTNLRKNDVMLTMQWLESLSKDVSKWHEKYQPVQQGDFSTSVSSRRTLLPRPPAGTPSRCTAVVTSRHQVKEADSGDDDAADEEPVFTLKSFGKRDREEDDDTIVDDEAGYQFVKYTASVLNIKQLTRIMELAEKHGSKDLRNIRHKRVRGVDAFMVLLQRASCTDDLLRAFFKADRFSSVTERKWFQAVQELCTYPDKAAALAPINS